MSNTQSDTKLADEYIGVIESLAALALYGENVEVAVHVVVDEACYFLSILNVPDSRAELIAFKYRLRAMAQVTHSSLSEYKRILEYASSIVVIH